MGEIRSTLDIIMEKTKDLTMTAEEKKEFEKGEVQGKVRGFLQKFLDGILDMERLSMEMAGLGENRRDMAIQMLRDECLGRMDLATDNTPLLDVLKQVAEVDTAPLIKILSAFQEALGNRMAAREKALGDGLREQGISGTAVIPNLRADPEWGRYLSQEQDAFRQKLHESTPNQP